MFFGRSSKLPRLSPVLVVDALGFANRIQAADAEELVRLSKRLEQQYHRFRAKVPFSIVFVTPRRVFGTSEFSTFQLNDMFVLFSERDRGDLIFRHLIASSLLYHLLLVEGFVPRGGLGFGLVLQGKQSLLGAGFIDAYNVAEKRDGTTRHICAIEVSPAFLARMPQSQKAYRLLCFYEGKFFLDPRALTDPEMGQFDGDRILRLLHSAGANQEKLDATSKFLTEMEDYDAALRPGSRSRQMLPPNGEDHTLF